ncbi:MAG: EAL domain-containing protein [Hespellia sp.]|nr:EAL domain-containing protein [Hespellia sp.]
MGELSILIVEDEKINRAILSKIFKENYRIYETENGKVALEMLQSGIKVDLILLDLLMPVMNGVEFLAAIKSDASFCDIPVVMNTQNEEPEMEARAFELGVDDFVTKPYNAKIITRRVDNLIRKYVLERRTMQAKLKTASEELDNLVDAIPGGVGIFEISDKVDWIYFNDGLHKLLGYTKEIFETELREETLKKSIVEEDFELLSEKIKESLVTGEKFQVTVRAKKATGEIIWVAINAHQLNVESEYPRFQMVFMNVTEEKKIEQEMKEMLSKLQYRMKWDVLTGIYNRQGFYHASAEMRAHDKGTPYVIAVWNIDHFKVVNELFGNAVGDQVLIHFAEILKENIPEGSGVFGRLEADRFATCAPKAFYEKTHERMKQYITKGIQGEVVDYPIYVHIGLYNVEDITESIGTMCDRAKLALQSIKTNAIKRSCCYTAEMSDQLYRDQKLVNEFDAALKNKQFYFLLQPVVDTVSGEVVSAEALVRWEHPDRGHISPGEFIPTFERNGYITELDFFVWEEVCRFLHENEENGFSNVPISINMSRKHFLMGNPKEKLISLLEKYKVPHEMLKLEITESAYIEHPEQILLAIKELQEQGFIILMDDFGSGYSSLNMLKDAPVDILKIDMAFMVGIKDSTRGSDILHSVVDMTKRIDMQTVAEGVETKEQYRLLKNMGCDTIQGYYFSKPLLPDDFRNYVTEHQSTKFLQKELENNKKWVLVIDDFEAIRVSVTAALADEYHVLTACDGKEGYKLLEEYKNQISFVLTDIIMPEMDGLALIQAMKENANLTQIPVMVFTADNDADKVLQAIALGARDAVRKPVDPEILRARIRNIID